MATIFTDSFTNATDPIALSSHSATWVRHSLYAPTINVSGGRAVTTEKTLSLYHANLSILSADYSVQALLIASTAAASNALAIAGRINTSAQTHYSFRHRNGVWGINKYVAAAFTAIGNTWSETLAAGDQRTMKLEMIGTTINGYINGVLRCTATDSSITATGRAGLFLYGTASDGGMDDFLVDDPLAGTSMIHAGDDLSVTLGRALIQGRW